MVAGFARSAVLALVLVVAPATEAVSQTGATVLHQPISARAAGMGETGVADNSDAANIFFNPANVVGPARVYVLGSLWGYDPFGVVTDIWTGGGSAGISHVRPDSQLTLAADFSYGRLDYGESIATDPFGTPLGVFDSHEDCFALTLGAGFALGEKWSLRLGSAAKRWDADLAGVQLDAFAFDLGVVAALHAAVSGWRVVPAIGVAFVNLGSEIDVPIDNRSDPLPTRLHFGTSVRIEGPTVRVLSADVPIITAVYNVDGTERMHDEPFSWGIGGELAVAQVLFVRTGSFDFDDDEASVNSGSGWGVGLGLPIGSFRARVDYTRTSASYEEDKLGVELDWML